MSTNFDQLLRRTLLGLGAAALLLGASVPVAAQTVTLSGATGNSCSYSSMTVQPNGSVSVACTGSPPVDPNPPVTPVLCATGPGPDCALFVVVSEATSAPANSGYFVTIARNYGPAGALTATYILSGTGCATKSGSVTLEAGVATAIEFTTSNAIAGVCNATITPPTGHSANPNSVTINITGGTGTPPVDVPNTNLPPGCTPQVGAVAKSLDFGPVDRLRMGTGTIAYYPVIPNPDPARASIEFTQGQQPNTPGGAVTEFYVSTCPGVIRTSPAGCYYRSNSVNSNKIVIYTKPKPEWGWVDQNSMDAYGCLADASTSNYKWYVNVRWTYPVCVWGNDCGFSMQWALGAW